MSIRELVVLGTASQVPTRTRAAHGALLRFDGEGILLDPGEGTQRQMTLAGVPASSVTQICITHAHGDHCLGLPGVIQRCSLDGLTRPLDVHFPAAATPYLQRLHRATSFEEVTPVRLHPSEPGPIVTHGALHVDTAELSHAIPTLGYRFTEPSGHRLLPERVQEAGVHGPARSELLRDGQITVGGRTVRLEEVSVPRPGQSAAFVMDTRRCDAAVELATDVDLLVIEATFLDSERDLADEAGHLTAGQAAQIGREAGARRVVLTHFSRRYPEPTDHLEQAQRAAPGIDVIVAHDLARIPVPARR